MRYIVAISLVFLAGCDTPFMQGLMAPATPPVVAASAPAAPPPVPTLNPTPPPPPPPQARTVEQFDTTTAEARAAALAVVPEPASEVTLGMTIASLGPPANPGIWIETPLVSALVMGRAEYNKTGKSVAVELRPSGGAAGSGSQISLAAMRLMEIPLTELAELTLFRP